MKHMKVNIVILFLITILLAALPFFTSVSNTSKIGIALGLMFISIVILLLSRKMYILKIREIGGEPFKKLMNEVAYEIGPFLESNVEKTYFGYIIVTIEGETYRIFTHEYNLITFLKDTR